MLPRPRCYTQLERTLVGLSTFAEGLHRFFHIAGKRLEYQLPVLKLHCMTDRRGIDVGPEPGLAGPRTYQRQTTLSGRGLPLHIAGYGRWPLRALPRPSQSPEGVRETNFVEEALKFWCGLWLVVRGKTIAVPPLRECPHSH